MNLGAGANNKQATVPEAAKVPKHKICRLSTFPVRFGL